MSNRSTSAYFRNAIKILSSIFIFEQHLSNSEPEIIRRIHQIRFHPQNPYLTTGSHFSDLFVRNMGIFYNALLDPRIPSTESDWQNRQEICYKTVKLALQSFVKKGTDATTISFFGKHNFTLLNIYSRASDSLYAVLYGLKMLTDMQTTLTRYPSTNSPTHHRLDTQIIQKTNELITHHRNELKILIEKYLSEVIDHSTNLIRKDIYLSSARDGIKRQSSFYDNVIAWATIQLALDLNIPLSAELYNSYTQNVKREKIIQSFWNIQTGIFNDELNTTTFSADQLIIITTQFLNPQDASDCQKLHSVISYIRKHQLDQPFPLQYSDDHQPSKLYWPVRYFAPNYMTRTIWSHWGIEYIKLFILLSSSQPDYLDHAAKHLQSYKKNIEKFGGYPECYDIKGNPYCQRLYRTVLHTSWIINYEQAKMLYSNSFYKNGT